MHYDTATLSTDQEASQGLSQGVSQGIDKLLNGGGGFQFNNLIPILASAGTSYIVSYMLGSTQNQAFMSAGISGASYYMGEGIIDWTGSDNEAIIFLTSSSINAGALTYIGADIGLSVGTALISSAAGSAAKYIMARPPAGNGEAADYNMYT